VDSGLSRCVALTSVAGGRPDTGRNRYGSPEVFSVHRTGMHIGAATAVVPLQSGTQPASSLGGAAHHCYGSIGIWTRHPRARRNTVANYSTLLMNPRVNGVIESVAPDARPHWPARSTMPPRLSPPGSLGALPGHRAGGRPRRWSANSVPEVRSVRYNDIDGARMRLLMPASRVTTLLVCRGLPPLRFTAGLTSTYCNMFH
jgi:hypothetical protein